NSGAHSERPPRRARSGPGRGRPTQWTSRQCSARRSLLLAARPYWVSQVPDSDAFSPGLEQFGEETNASPPTPPQGVPPSKQLSLRAEATEGSACSSLGFRQNGQPAGSCFGPEFPQWQYRRGWRAGVPRLQGREAGAAEAWIEGESHFARESWVQPIVATERV